jgi:hypothetical protein
MELCNCAFGYCCVFLTAEGAGFCAESAEEWGAIAEDAEVDRRIGVITCSLWLPLCFCNCEKTNHLRMYWWLIARLRDEATIKRRNKKGQIALSFFFIENVV